MADLRPGPLAPDLEALLDAERAAAPPAIHALDRVWSRVAEDLGRAPGDGQRRAQARGSELAARTGPRAWVAAHAVPLVAVSFVAGALVGAGLHAALSAGARGGRVGHGEAAPTVALAGGGGRPGEPPRSPDEGAERSATTAPAARAPSSGGDGPSAFGSPSPALPPRAAAHASPGPRAATPPPEAAQPSDLTAERALLDAARAALVRGEPTNALSLTDEHARRFARPELGEEREAIAIQALVLAHHYADARARARAFEASSPNSLFLPAVAASLASIPP